MIFLFLFCGFVDDACRDRKRGNLRYWILFLSYYRARQLVSTPFKHKKGGQVCHPRKWHTKMREMRIFLFPTLLIYDMNNWLVLLLTKYLSKTNGLLSVDFHMEYLGNYPGKKSCYNKIYKVENKRCQKYRESSFFSRDRGSAVVYYVYCGLFSTCFLSL